MTTASIWIRVEYGSPTKIGDGPPAPRVQQHFFVRAFSGGATEVFISKEGGNAFARYLNELDAKDVALAQAASRRLALPDRTKPNATSSRLLSVRLTDDWPRLFFSVDEREIISSLLHPDEEMAAASLALSPRTP
jgi:hypothetical protein